MFNELIASHSLVAGAPSSPIRAFCEAAKLGKQKISMSRH
jgi:hypothetical protein